MLRKRTPVDASDNDPEIKIKPPSSGSQIDHIKIFALFNSLKIFNIQTIVELIKNGIMYAFKKR